MCFEDGKTNKDEKADGDSEKKKEEKVEQVGLITLVIILHKSLFNLIF